MRVKIISVLLVLVCIILCCIFAPLNAKTYNLGYSIIIEYSWDLIILAVSILIIESFNEINKSKFFILGTVIFLSGIVVDSLSFLLFEFLDAYVRGFTDKIPNAISLFLYYIIGFILVYKCVYFFSDKILYIDNNKLRKIGLTFAFLSNPIMGLFNNYIHTSGLAVFSRIFMHVLY